MKKATFSALIGLLVLSAFFIGMNLGHKEHTPIAMPIPSADSEQQFVETTPEPAVEVVNAEEVKPPAPEVPTEAQPSVSNTFSVGPKKLTLR